MKFSWFFITVLLFGSCVGDAMQNEDTSSVVKDSFITIVPKYASGFSIQSHNSNHILEVTNPWQGAANVSYRYALHGKGYKFDSSTKIDQTITVPVSRVVCLSTTHIAFIDFLNQSDAIVGVSGIGFVNSPTLVKRIENGEVRDVGFEQAINYELLLSLKPQVVFAYGVGAEMAGYLQKLNDLNIPVVFIGDYLEENPLGKAEWLKVFSLFFDKFSIADSIFNDIETEYLYTKEKLQVVDKKPNVFINLPWKDAWFFPGNHSYIVRLIEDAGGNYLLSHLEGSRSYAHSIEAAIEHGANAHIWINTGSANSVQEILNEVPITRILPPVLNGNIFNNNSRVNIHGGNDFWESGVVNPQIVLRDLAKIFHPQSIEHELVYYKQLN